jgi:hypothetical protein
VKNFTNRASIQGKTYFTHFIKGTILPTMSPLALQLQPADISPQTEFIIYSPDHGLVSAHFSEEEARASFDSYLSEHEMGEYLPFLLQRSGEEWEIAGC